MVIPSRRPRAERRRGRGPSPPAFAPVERRRRKRRGDGECGTRASGRRRVRDSLRPLAGVYDDGVGLEGGRERERERGDRGLTGRESRP